MATIDRAAPPAAQSKEDVLTIVEEHDIQFIRLWFTDILGQLKSFAVSRTELEGALEEGMGFDGSSINGFNRIEESDMIAMPDPGTFTMLPWRADGAGRGAHVLRRPAARTASPTRATRAT